MSPPSPSSSHGQGRPASPNLPVAHPVALSAVKFSSAHDAHGTPMNVQGRSPRQGANQVRRGFSSLSRESRSGSPGLGSGDDEKDSDGSEDVPGAAASARGSGDRHEK